MSSKWECVVATVLFSHWLWGPQLPARRLCERPTADNLWIADTLWYCYCWSLDVVWCSMVSMVKWRRASALHCFTVDLQFGVLSQRSSMIRAPWPEIIRLFTWGYWLYCGCIPIRSMYVCTYVRMCVFMYVCKYVCMYACMYVCTHVSM